MNEGTTNRTQTSSGNETGKLRALATERIRRRRNFQLHIAAYILGTLTVTIVWAVTEYHNAGGWPTGFRTGRQNHDWDPWIIYPLIAGTIALTVHAWTTFGRGPTTEADINREMERLRADGFA